MPLRRNDVELAGKHVFITGAASGIGRATAFAAAREGAILHLTDRNSDALADVAAEIRDGLGTVGLFDACDVSDLEAVRALAARLTQEYGAMDVIMNIAGISAWGTVRSMSHQTWRDLIEINLMGPIHVIEELIPPMIESGRGGALVNCSSAAGIIGMPWHAAYSASKFGLRGISEVLRFDLERHDIRVSVVCPGAVRTGLVETVEVAGADRGSPAFQRLKRRFEKHARTPEQAAASIPRGIEKDRYYVYTSPEIAVGHFFQRVFPLPYELVMRRLNREFDAVGRKAGGR